MTLPRVLLVLGLAAALVGGSVLVVERLVSRPTVSPVPTASVARTPVRGLDVSNWQGNVKWTDVKKQGPAFAYIKATLGTDFRSPYFSQQYKGATAIGLVRGAYHFALPLRSGGARQADFFVAHGGGWSRDGRTLPGALDIEFNPYSARSGRPEYRKNQCYSMTPAAMRGWIRAFLARYHQRTGRHAVIYTTTSWWKACTGNDREFAATSPLWIARYQSSVVGPLPAGWTRHTFWQHSSTGPFPGDSNVFNGTAADLRKLALG
ncbi:lysozyme [Cryptosporangium phraense]|uniref:lysozyme n=1 Tax=Cryptosporangium phraense TaxID=2593070 RepID=A0A545AP59_9ACTN|nr:lysozyme [Cryptosporangium phraense]TQS43119.1 hydrolase [Cryptosporangium phraense]